MDINFLRSLTTVLSFGIFIGILIWTYSRRNRERFEEAARLPFALDQDERTPQ